MIQWPRVRNVWLASGRAYRIEYECGCITTLVGSVWAYVKACPQHPQEVSIVTAPKLPGWLVP